MQSNNANKNLKNRYVSVLKKCAIINTFGSLALAAAFVISPATETLAAEIANDTIYNKAYKLSSYDGNSYSKHIKESETISGRIISDERTKNLTFLASRTDEKTQYTKVIAEENAVIVNENSITLVSEKVLYIEKKKYSFWVQPMYQNITSNEYSVNYTTTAGIIQNDDNDYTRNTFGINLGADIALTDNFKVGAAIQAGSADSTLARIVNNDASFYGISLYASYTMNALTVKADLGYVYTDNDIDIAASSDHFSANSVTLGAVAEYRIATPKLDIIPYVGARVTNVSASSANLGAGLKVSSQNATAFTFPVGVRLEKEFKTETGVSVIPHANLGLEFAAGDLDEVEAVTVVGVRNESRFMNNILDPVTFQVGVGLELVKDEYSFNFDYDYRVSKHTNEHAIMAIFRYKF